MTGPDQPQTDPLASSIWHVDRTTPDVVRISGGSNDPRALVVVRDHRRVSAIIPLGPTGAPERAPEVLAAPPAPPRPWDEGAGARLSATVVLCTTGRCDVLPRSVESVLAQDHPGFRLVVVDNAPASGRTRAALAGIDDDRMTIVEAPRAGLSRARNRGVLAATGDVVAFTDDDALVDPHWLTALLDPLAADPAVGATTGVVLAAELATAAQRWFESRGGFPKDLVPRVWSVGSPPAGAAGLGDAGEGGPLYPVTTARVGAGVCMAIRRDALAQAGPFDPALGAGTPTRGGEDLDMFARILRLGRPIVHTPDALVHHRHRRDPAGLDAQIRGNGSGMAALLVKSALERPSTLLVLASRVPAILTRLSPGSERVSGADDDVPASLTASEIKGFLEGPLLYAKSRRANRPAPSRGRRA
ncbi:glycosyltransferase [Actinomyces sp. B33]|uniref:glycosyltransferase family 2 protein n=1 Tax=Actinomyces sp. B33 TaxID=2942131 RepID=UPI00234289C5|nr:glycosyltransferase [Actinomyces sp. B33]MDC4233602.1 glycosyltransferase [Actinomyces sp. B33]